MSSSLEKLLFFTNPQKVLAFLLAHPSSKFYDREIAKLSGVSRAGANFALRDLAKAGLVQREKKGRMFFYFIDPKDTLICQLKVVQNITLLMPLISKIKKECLRIVLYGSAANGTNQEESDVDLFILSRTKEKISLPFKIQPVIHTPQEWIKIERSNPVFANQIEKGIVLWNSNEL